MSVLRCHETAPADPREIPQIFVGLLERQVSVSVRAVPRGLLTQRPNARG